MIYMEYVNVGKIYTTHGLNGEVKVKSNFNYKDKIYVNGFNFYIGKDKNISGKIKNADIGRLFRFSSSEGDVVFSCGSVLNV